MCDGRLHMRFIAEITRDLKNMYGSHNFKERIFVLQLRVFNFSHMIWLVIFRPIKYQYFIVDQYKSYDYSYPVCS